MALPIFLVEKGNNSIKHGPANFTNEMQICIW